MIKIKRIAALGATSLTGAALLVGAPTAAWAKPPAVARVLFVAPNGADSAKPGVPFCRAAHPCHTISFAVTKAAAGDAVLVAPGTYPEGVTVPKRLTLGVWHRGPGRPTVDAKNKANGFLISGPAAAGTVVTGFSVQNATHEGILALRTSHVTITGNVVTHNDTGFNDKKAQPPDECAVQGEIPGDCGEAIHLMTTSDSQVVRNVVNHNVGGILLTDEFGPTARNLIARNIVTDNAADCGITLPSHNADALSSNGTRQPSKGGVYKNLVLGNLSARNGGAGILVAVAVPGAASYDNGIGFNTVFGNGLPGVTVHTHAPNQDVNGTVVAFNAVGPNAPKGDPDAAGVTQSTGVLFNSDVVPVKGAVVAANRFVGLHFGVWTHNAHAAVFANKFVNVAVPVTQT